VLRINFPDPRLRDVELLLRLIALALFAPKYKGDLRAFLDGAMHSLNQSWNLRGQQVEGLTSELFSGVNAGLEIFGRELGRKIRGGKVESALNRALFEVQSYYLSLPRVRQVALQNKEALVARSRTLFDDSEFLSSIESTTKSIQNYRLRFDRYQGMLQDTLKTPVAPLQIASK
jgi:hypothetical protein